MKRLFNLFKILLILVLALFIYNQLRTNTPLGQKIRSATSFFNQISPFISPTIPSSDQSDSNVVDSTSDQNLDSSDDINNNNQESFDSSILTDQQWVEITFDSQADGYPSVSIMAEVAHTEKAKQQGLMNRTNLPQYNGTLFVYDAVVNYSFWMKNTNIPLDLILIDSNQKIVEIIKNLKPCTEIDPKQKECPKYQPKKQYQLAIEVNQGFIEENHIQVGQAIRIQNSE